MTAERIRATLEGLTDLPLPVEDWEVELGLDSTGDEAAWVWVILKDEDFDWKSVENREAREHLRQRVKMAVSEEAGATLRWAYVRFRTVSEKVKEG